MLLVGWMQLLLKRGHRIKVGDEGEKYLLLPRIDEPCRAYLSSLPRLA